jgi:GNAT superfamily N-acetyltransferase
LISHLAEGLLMAVIYRRTLPERSEFFTLFEATGWNREYRLDDGQLFEAIQQSWYCISAYESDRLVGFGRVISDGVLHALIVDLIVLPTHQGRGIGRAVLAALVERCTSCAIRDVQLFCAQGKVGFYHKCGFVERPADAPGMELRR